MKKIIIDILMFILMLIEFSKVYLPPQIHEIVGICLIALVIVHLILNRKYIKAIPKGKYNLKRSSFLIINVVFMIVFILTMIFGLLSSQEILTFLNIGSLTTVYLHKILAYLCLILLGIHLGMNMNGMFKKIEEKLPKTLTYFLYILIIIFGIYSMVQVDFINHITGNHGFSIVTGNILINTIEYLFIILMFSVIAHLILKIEK
jgi:hypothetical protein